LRNGDPKARDYLDVADLSHHVGLAKTAAALERVNSLDPWNDWRAVQAQCISLAAALLTPPR
jgi:hypothetical protein